MTRLERMYDEIERSGIKVYDYHFSKTKKACCVYKEPESAIAIDIGAVENTAEELTLLGEEYAHYETGALYLIEATYNTPIARSNRIWAEGRARRRNIRKLVPLEELREASKSCAYADGLDIYELAEHFEVTPELIKTAIEQYVTKF